MVDVDNGDYGEVGISLEPLSVLEALMNEKALTTVQPAANGIMTALQRIAENAFNYLSSYAKPAMQYGQEQVVPLRVLQEWFSVAMRKAASDPNFCAK